MSRRSDQIYDLAVQQWSDEGIDIVGPVSEGDDNGAYIQAWVWVDFTDTPLDKNAETLEPPVTDDERSNGPHYVPDPDEDPNDYRDIELHGESQIRGMAES